MTLLGFRISKRILWRIGVRKEILFPIRKTWVGLRFFWSRSMSRRNGLKKLQSAIRILTQTKRRRKKTKKRKSKRKWKAAMTVRKLSFPKRKKK